MTTTTETLGRLGNQIIRNLAVSLIAEKYDLYVNYSSKTIIDGLGINLFCGKNSYNHTTRLHDYNYFSIYNSGEFKENLEPNHSFFQTKDIINFLYNYLHTDKIKSNIIDKNRFKSRYNNNNDVFIHVRLTDVAHFNPGINYYLKTIQITDFDNLYISTDDCNHSIIQQIIEHYPNAQILNYDEKDTIHFGSTCKNIILSHGSFSAVIGYLSFFSNINYPEYEPRKIWYGDMFSINNWTKHSV